MFLSQAETKANTDLGLCRAQICMPGCGLYRSELSAIRLRNQEAGDLKIDREKHGVAGEINLGWKAERVILLCIL